MYRSESKADNEITRLRSIQNADSNKEGDEADEDNDMEDEEYGESVSYARQQLADYYGTAAQFFPGAYEELTQLDGLSSDEILHAARENGLM